jgi:hypothetical protein
MVNGAGRVGFGKHDTCPQPLRPDEVVRDRRQAPHPSCLRRLIVELKRFDDSNSYGTVWDRRSALPQINTNRHGIPPWRAKLAEAFTAWPLPVLGRPLSVSDEGSL